MGIDPYVRNVDKLIWLTAGAFSNTIPKALQQFGNLGYETLNGPGLVNLDTGIHKTFRFLERHQIQFRLETFNSVNHVNFTSLDATLSDPNFGKLTSAAGGRNVQLALKYLF